MRGKAFIAALVLGLGAAPAAYAQDFYFTDDFDYGTMANFAGTNGWVGGWTTSTASRRFGTGGDNWQITSSGKLKAKTDTHCGQEYGESDCAFGSGSYAAATGTASGVNGSEPEDNWIVRSNAASLADPDFQMVFQFDNTDDDTIGMVFRMQNSNDFYVYGWSYRDVAGVTKGVHHWDLPCCSGGHVAPICGTTATPQPAICTAEPTFAPRVIGRAQGHGGWLYRVRNGVMTEIASTTVSYIQGQTYNVRIRGVGRTVTIWMDRTNNGFDDADKVIEVTDNAADAILTGGAYGLWQFDNDQFVVDGFVAEEAPIPPVIDASSVGTTIDQKNAFVRFVAAANRTSTWTVDALAPTSGGACSGAQPVLFSGSPASTGKTLDLTLPGFNPGTSYCYRINASNSLGSNSFVSSAPITMLAAVVVATPTITSTSTTSVNASYTSSVSGAGTFAYEAGDCAGGGYALDVGRSGANTLAQISDRASLDLGTQQTVEAWVYVKAGATNTWTRILGKGVDSTNHVTYALWHKGNGRVMYQLGDGSGACSVQSANNAVPLNAWKHVAGRYNGSLVEVLVNGVVVASGACTRTPSNNASAFRVGYDGSTTTFQGLIAHVGLYNASLSNAEITAHVTAGAAAELSPIASSVLLWHFREGPTTDAVRDSSALLNHGFLGNTPGADSGDPLRFPSPAITVAHGTGTSFSGPITGLTFGQTYCSRATAVVAADGREGASALRKFQIALDVVPPTVVPGPTVALQCTGTSGATHTLTPPTVTDLQDPAPTLSAYRNSVAPENIIAGPPYTATFPYAPPGPTTIVIWKATDAGGNSAQANQTVWIDDTAPPTLNAGNDVIAEATSPAGTPVNLSPIISDACDATPTSSNDAPALYPLGLTTVSFGASDDAGNSASDTINVTIVDTTPPTFTDDPGACPASLPDLTFSAPVGCYTGALPAPLVSDNAHAAELLALFVRKGAGAETPLGGADQIYCPGEGTVVITWRVVDPLGNECTATQNVNLGAAATLDLTFAGLSIEGSFTSASLANNGKFFNQDVTVAVSANGTGCGAATTFTWTPTPASQSSSTFDADTMRGIATYSAENEYPAVVVTASCGGSDAINGEARFGIDRTDPASDFSEIPQSGVLAGDEDTYARVFFGETIDLGAFEAMDTLGPVQSGILSVALSLEHPTGLLELDLGRIDPAATSVTPIEKGPASAGVATADPFACAGAGSVCADGTVAFDVHELSVFDSGERDAHRLGVTVIDRAGNVTSEAYYFYVNDWSDAVGEAVVRAQALVDDPFNVFALSELEDAQDHLLSAATYVSLSEVYLEGSTLRAQYAVDYYEDAETFGILVEPQREYLSRAAWGDVLLYTRGLSPTVAGDQNFIDAALLELNDGVALRAAGSYGALIRDARTARDAVALLYPAYQPFRAKQAEAQGELASYDPASSGWGALSMPHVAPTQEMVDLARTFLQDSTLAEIDAVLGDPATAERLPLQTLVDAIVSVDPCLQDLAAFNLSDLEYTQCYLAIDSMARTLSSVEISLVTTYRWQAAMALTLFGMLNVSRELSPTSIGWVLAGGADPPWTDPVDWAAADPSAGLAQSEYEAAVAALDAGDVLTAYDRFSANRCLLIKLYNRYYSSSLSRVNDNVSGGPPTGYEDPILSDPLCADNEIAP